MTTRRYINCLQSVPEALEALDDLATSRGALVGPPELEIQKQCNNDDETGCDHASNDTGDVVGFVLCTENSATDDATNATSTDESSRA